MSDRPRTPPASLPAAAEVASGIAGAPQPPPSRGDALGAHVQRLRGAEIQPESPDAAATEARPHQAPAVGSDPRHPHTAGSVPVTRADRPEMASYHVLMRDGLFRDFERTRVTRLEPTQWGAHLPGGGLALDRRACDYVDELPRL